MSKISQNNLLGQYIVYKTGPEGKSVSWGLVNGESDVDVTGINEKDLPYGDDNNFDVRRKDIIAVLGKKPAFGNAYGCKIEPFLRTVESETWGSLHFFTKLEDEDKAKLKEGLNRVGKRLKREGLAGFLPIDLEIRQPRGRWAGTYRAHSKPGKRDVMNLHPKAWENVPSLLYHESGHGVWFRLMTNKQRARWIALYHSYLKVAECDGATVKGLKNDFCGQDQEHVKDFKGQLDEDNVPVFEACIDHITSHHGLSVDNINTLISGGEGEVLKGMWPTSKVLHTDYEYPISDYASTKPEEFFAEAFMFHMAGTKLPKRIAALMATTLQRCAGRSSSKEPAHEAAE